MSSRRPQALFTFAACLAGLLAACGSSHKLKYPLCESDRDCHAGEHCHDKQCAQCAVDSDCPHGQRCVDGACKAGCSDDTQCPAGNACIEGQCKACSGDADCGPGGRCQNGTCQRARACKTDDDCPPDKDCVNGLCIGDKAAQTGKPAACTLQPIYFSFDSSVVDQAQSVALQADGECIKRATAGVTLEGHTDPSGTEDYNLGLSDRRARSVVDQLGTLGIDEGRLRVVPMGEAGTTDSDDEATRAKERRVDVKW